VYLLSVMLVSGLVWSVQPPFHHAAACLLFVLLCKTASRDLATVSVLFRCGMAGIAGPVLCRLTIRPAMQPFCNAVQNSAAVG
jgi:hypothetical protein